MPLEVYFAFVFISFNTPNFKTMNYRTITEEINRPDAKGILMYLVPDNGDHIDPLKMLAYQESCICWMLLREGEIALDYLLNHMGIDNTIDQCIGLFHRQMFERIAHFYKIGDEIQVDKMIRDIDNFISHTVKQYYEKILRN